MRLLFVIPPQIMKSADGYVDVKASISIPLGPLYIASYIKEQQWQGIVEVYDARLSAKIVDYPDGSKIFGDSWDIVDQKLVNFKPDVIAISNMFSWQIDGAIELSRRAKEVLPATITVLGGPHASSFPVKMIELPTIDYVVMGEGEDRLLRVLNALKKGEPVKIQGVLHNKDDMNLLHSNKKAPIKFIADLDKMPLPAYDMVDVERYFFLQSHGFAPRPRELGKRAVTILTSRGCPHQCIFCSIQTTMGYKFRYHSAEYVKNHIQYLRDNYDIDFIHFEDDNFTYDVERYENILDILLDQKPVIHWDTPNGVRADSWTRERIKKTKESGCQHLCIAIESPVQRVIDEVVKKNLDLSTVEPVMKACKEEKLSLNAYYVLGLAGERAEEIQQTVDYALDKYERLDVYPTFSLANPIPGTEFYDIVMENNYLHKSAVNKPPRPNTIQTEAFDPEFIQQLYDLANKRKTLITIKKMLTSYKSFCYFSSMAMRNTTNLKNIIYSSLRSVVGRTAVLVFLTVNSISKTITDHPFS